MSAEYLSSTQMLEHEIVSFREALSAQSDEHRRYCENAAEQYQLVLQQRAQLQEQYESAIIAAEAAARSEATASIKVVRWKQRFAMPYQ